MLPSIFGENLFDDFFSDPFGMMVPQGRDPTEIDFISLHLQI